MPVAAQVEWSHFSARGAHTMSLEPNTNRVLALGGLGSRGPLVEFQALVAGAWSPLPGSAPPPTIHGAMAPFGANGSTVLFGGVASGVVRNETWVFDGNSWGNQNPSIAPPARSNHAMVYMPQRARIVLFGGLGTNGELDDTWEWDSVTWIRRFPNHQPAPMSGHAMALDTTTQRVVLHAGFPHFTTAEYDGNDWNLSTPPFVPDNSWSTTMASSPNGGVLLFGGMDPIRFAPTSRLWRFSNGAWSLLRDTSYVSGPSPREHAQMVHVPSTGSVILHGGIFQERGPVQTLLNDTWEWDGAGWQQIGGATTPVATTSAAFAFDSLRERLILHGGLIGVETNGAWCSSATYAYVGGLWSHLAQGPSVERHAMAYDESRDRVVCFGGLTLDFQQNETWEFDGSVWTQRFPAHRPSPRLRAAMGYDRGRQRILLFGGGYVTADNNETWEYDGIDWTQRFPATSPPMADGAILCYDDHVGRLLLVDQGVWTWNGSTWILLDATPPPGHGPCVFDSLRQRLVRASGHEWTPQGWLARAPGDVPPPFAEWGAFGFDRTNGECVLYGGETTTGYIIGDVWRYGTTIPAQATPFGAGCPSLANVHYALRATSMPPWIGTTFEVALAPAIAPPFSVGMLGGSATTWGNLALPLDLGFFGMPGCLLRVAPLDLVFVPSGSWRIPIPDVPGLTAAPLFLQAFPLEPGVNPTGLLATGGLAMQLGIR